MRECSGGEQSHAKKLTRVRGSGPRNWGGWPQTKEGSKSALLWHEQDVDRGGLNVRPAQVGQRQALGRRTKPLIAEGVAANAHETIGFGRRRGDKRERGRWT